MEYKEESSEIHHSPLQYFLCFLNYNILLCACLLFPFVFVQNCSWIRGKSRLPDPSRLENEQLKSICKIAFIIDGHVMMSSVMVGFVLWCE